MMTAEPSQTIRLTCTTNGSNKEYIARLKPAPDGTGWLLECEYGAIGARLNHADKITTPAPYEKARKAFDKLVKSKLSGASRYVVDLDGSDGLPDAQPRVDAVFTGILPQLLNPIAEEELAAYLASNDWWMQQKYDGERVLLKLAGVEEVTGINRKGVARPLPVGLVAAVKAVELPCLLDGELIGGDYYVFDLLEIGGVDLRADGFRERAHNLEAYFKLPGHAAPEAAAHLLPVKTFCTEPMKRYALGALRERGREGVVFRRVESPYREGRPASGGDAIKFKFVESATVRVKQAHSTKRSIAIEMRDGETWMGMGNVTIPPNAAVPVPGAIVECQYLYVRNRLGSLYQPVYKGERDDQDEGDCDIAQLKYKDVAAAA